MLPTPMKKAHRTILAIAMSAAGLLAAIGGTGSPAFGDPADQVPKVIKQVRPIYPYSLARSGYRGEVLIDFVVDKEGNVVHPSVLKSSHPDFEAPAVEAILEWKFTPGMKNGQPVFAHMQMPISFNIEYAFNRPGGVDVWTIPPRASEKLPPDFQYDEPPKPILTSAPVYPFELLRQKVTGKATVSFAIDTQGQTHAVKVESASLPEFGAATSAMIAAWRFEPAKRNGQPCWAVLRKEQVFDRYQHDFPINDSAERLLKDLGRSPCPILVNARDLDAPLAGRFQPGPIVPTAVWTANARSEALVEFIVDHAGHAQLPRVVSAADPEFGWAAATAVARWQYTQPTRNGKPVDVFVRVPLVFSPPKPPAPGS